MGTCSGPDGAPGSPPPAGTAVSVHDPAERDLVLQLLGFPDAIAAAVDGQAPSRLAGYLFALAAAFTAFYEHCPVLKASDDQLRASRLTLCDLTARTLHQGLDLLGIEAPDRM